MKAFLMHPAANFDPSRTLPGHEAVLRKDLELGVLFKAMAGEDDFVLAIAHKAMLLCLGNDAQTILYRQDVLRDCLAFPDAIRQLYAFATEAVEARKRSYWAFTGEHPSSVLHGAVDVMQMFVNGLRKMRAVADAHVGQCGSRGLGELFAMLRAELSDAYLARVQSHLDELKFRQGILMSAGLGPGNESTNFVLRRPDQRSHGFLKRMFGRSSPSYTFRLADRDEAGAKAVAQMRNRGINRVANALAQSMDHVLAFFQMLRTELAFYVGCLNLASALEAMGRPVTFPQLHEGAGPRRFNDLYDPCLALASGGERNVVGNTLDVGDRRAVIITGANQGGKSSFLRSIGLAQLMMQSGMFVAAAAYAGSVCRTLHTHYKREEDAAMRHGKLDEELGRMSAIARELGPGAMVLFNESFASTDEREGSEIARQVTQALVQCHVVVYFVTHLYGFARGLAETDGESVLFLRAQRLEDGTRTFRLLEGKPMATSYADDLYREIFQAR